MLCDRIEEFIIELLEHSQGEAELKRNELAVHFGCAPSQISYVLSTRFCPMRGYMVKSRRGGGGCIRIWRIDIRKAAGIASLIEDELSAPVSSRRAEEIVRDLAHSGVVPQDRVGVMIAAVSPHALGAAGESENAVRSAVLKSMLLQCVED